MINMDICGFIISKAIRSHCRKIRYEFTPVEAAFLIYQSREHTLAEKHAAWRELTEKMPDAEIKQRNHVRGYESLHDDGYVYRFDKMYRPIFPDGKEQYDPQEGIVCGEGFGLRCYSSLFLHTNGENTDYDEGGKLYDDFQTGLHAEMCEVQKELQDFSHYRVVKQKIITQTDNTEQRIFVEMTCDGVPLRI